jgi:hypothetical protein
MPEATTQSARRIRPKGDGFGRKAESNRSLAFLPENLRFVSRHVLLTGFEPFGPSAVNPDPPLASPALPAAGQSWIPGRRNVER